MNVDNPIARHPMPGWLKLMTAHALFCFMLVLVAVIPRSNYQLGGDTVSYAQWWASGVGPLIASLGLIMTTAGVLFLLRRGFGRYLYLGVFAAVLIGSRLYEGQLLAAAFGAIVVIALGTYLFRNKSVCAYFQD